MVAIKFSRWVTHLFVFILFSCALGVNTPTSASHHTSTAPFLPNTNSLCPPLPPPTGSTISVSSEADLRYQAFNAEPGTTILIEAGTYNMGGFVHIFNEGIILRGESGDRGEVILDFGGMISGYFGILVDADDVTIADLTIRNAHDHGVSIQGRDRPVLYNLHILDVRDQLVKVNPGGNGSEDGLLACSRLEYTTSAPDNYTNGISAHNAHRWVVRDNQWHRIRTISDDPVPTILFWSGSTDTLVERNLLVDCYQGISFGNASHGSGDHSGGIVRNNMIYGSMPHDVVIEMVHAAGWLVAHNTALLLNPDEVTWGMEARYPDSQGTFANNLTNLDIWLDRDGADGSGSGDITDAQADWFVNPSDADLHLTSDAAVVIDQATMHPEVTDDFDGDPRPLGTAADVGADEYRFPASKAYFIHPDGGDNDQCTGLVNAPYPGSGVNQACAWDHPFRALPPGGTPRIAGGDTLIIAASSYRMGYGAPDLESFCEPEGSFDCHIPPIPSGPDKEHPTRILGEGWDSGCGDPPELWGAERPWYVLNLTDSSNVELACLEITDHSSCVEDHAHEMGGSTLTCVRDETPYGEWAPTGIYAQDSSNVSLQDLDIHGLANTGIHAGRLTDWTVENVRIAGNGWAGWDGDISGDDSNSGTLTFRHWTVEWNGCGETYPAGEPVGCWGQTAGGYGDGVGTGSTGGDWIIEDSLFLHNTSDGLDLLYHDLGGTITLNKVRSEGNAGNQIKVTGKTTITNSVLVGNCAFFEDQPFTYNVDPCRALGNTLEVIYTGGEKSSVINSTIYGHGDGLVYAGPRKGHQCNGSETLVWRNNVLLGDTDFFDPGDLTFLFYYQNCPGLSFDSDYNIYHNIKLSSYVEGPHDLSSDPQLAGPLSGITYGMNLTADSPAIDSGENGSCPQDDILHLLRPLDGNGDGFAICDMGAYEWLDVNIWVHLPMIRG